MRKFLKDKKRVGIIVAALLVVAIAVPVLTNAYLVAATDVATNTFEVKFLETGIIEELPTIGSGVISKAPYIVNFGSIGTDDDLNWLEDENYVGVNTLNAYVRAKVTISPAGAATLGTLGDGWVDGEDGFYYYTKVLTPAVDEDGDAISIGRTEEYAAADYATTPIFSRATLAEGFEGSFDIGIYQEAVMAVRGKTTEDTLAVADMKAQFAKAAGNE